MTRTVLKAHGYDDRDIGKLEDHLATEKQAMGSLYEKNGDENAPTYSVDELAEVLPESLWTEVKEHLSDPEGPSHEEELEVEKMFTPFDPPADEFDDVDDADATGALDLFYEAEGVEVNE
jgi:hypothetical protein